MNKKIMLAVSSAIYGASLGAVAFSAQPVVTGSSDLQFTAVQSVKAKNVKSFVRSKLSKKIIVEEGLSGVHDYIIRLKDASVAAYSGGVKGLKATNPAMSKRNNIAKKVSNTKLNKNAPEVKAYRQYLASKQASFLSEASQKAGAQLTAKMEFKSAINGMVLSLTQEQAVEIAKLRSVAYVERDSILQLHTDVGPTLIGSPNVWDGTATGVETMGEGTIVGIIDTGINTDHDSFAAVGGDDYAHVNPFGEGVYVGDCADGFPELCNDKLIGVRSYSVITDVYSDADVFGDTPPAANGEDYNGHGSHTASTAGGNVLMEVPHLTPEAGEKVGDGTPTGYVVGQISGVAPHANVISYQVCWPGTNGDTYNACPQTATIAAVNHAIEDGVDVINFSIGGGGVWASNGELAFLSAQQAGIFVATSAGNGGPGPQTAKGAPWYTSVAASTHGRTIDSKKTVGDFSGGDTEAPAEIAGTNSTDGYTGTIVYAGDFTNANDPDGDPAQCLQPFPAETFSGEIVVCDRGAIARTAKADNAAAGGAGGVVLANLQDGASTLNSDVFIVPGIHISADDGDVLKTWLASGEGHMATISGFEIGANQVEGDDLAGFSSRGPNEDIVADIMTPSVAAPGVDIYAAYADEQYGYDVTGPAATDFIAISGTSMASPHVAGAGALLKALNPTWTADNIRSALMLTATTNMRKEDGVTDADLFDMGSGRIQVDVAAQTGLIMDETYDNYVDANPAEGGDPKTLNIPSLGNVSCAGVCSWTRTFTATQDGDWTLSGMTDNDGVTLAFEPEMFSIVAGATQSVTVTATLNGLATGDEVKGQVSLTAAAEGVPTAHLPMYLTANTSNLPKRINMEVNRNAGSTVLRGAEALEITEFTPRVKGLTKGMAEMYAVGQDSDNGAAYDDVTDGIHTSFIDVATASDLLYVGISNAESPDFDLYVGLDANGDGVPSEDEELCTAATAAANEVCEIEEVEAGSYWVMVQNWAASAEDAEDAFTLTTAYIGAEDTGNFTLAAQESSDAFTPFDIRMSWNDDMMAGDIFLGSFSLSTDMSDDNAGNLGSSIVMLTRGEDDVQLSVDNDNPMVGDVVTFTIDMPANNTDEDYVYNISTMIPEGIAIDEDSLTVTDGAASVVTAGVSGSLIDWGHTREGIAGAEPSYVITNNIVDESCVTPNFGQAGNFIDLGALGVAQNPNADGDGATLTFNIATPFLGQVYPSFTVGDDGFITFGAYGGATWTNQLLPDSAAPNGLLAPFWRDLQFDLANGSGVSVATAGAAWTIIQWDAMRHWAYYNQDPQFDDVLDFQIVINNATGEIMYVYDDITHNWADQLGQTIGWENAAGTNGDNYIYSGAAGTIGTVADITDDLVICNRVVTPNAAAVLTVSGTVMPEAAGAMLTASVDSSSSNIGSTNASSSIMINVQNNFMITDIADTTTVEDTALTGVMVEYTDAEMGDNTITVTSDDGVASNISGGESGATFDITPNQDFVGEMMVTVTVTDNEVATDTISTSFTVVVSPVNDAPTVAASAAQTNEDSVTTIGLNADAMDVDGDNLTYTWVQTGGHSVTIENANSAMATVNKANTKTGKLTFEVTVSDGVLTATDSVEVRTNKKSDGGASMGWLLLMMGLLGLRRRR